MWTSRFQFKYIDPTDMEKVGLTRPIFGHLWSLIQLSRQQHPRPEGMNTKEWEWQLVNDHVEKFNRHRLERLSPSERPYANKIFSRWYFL